MFFKCGLLCLFLASNSFAAPNTIVPLPKLDARGLGVNATNAARACGGCIKIGYGQQLQDSDGLNHWVVWVHGEDACPGQRVIGPLKQSICSNYFSWQGKTTQFFDCGSGEPTSAHWGAQDLNCKKKNYKITCHGSSHDIVQHGYCD
jgi:hypothetical protein